MRSSLRRLRLLPLLVVPLALAACDAPTSVAAGTLTLEETIAALRALQQVAAPVSRSLATDGVAGRAASQGEPIAFSTACPGGGSYQVTGTLGGWSSGADSIAIPLYELRERFAKCAVSSAGRAYVFDSDPELRTRVGFRMVDRQTGRLSMEGSFTGAFVLVSDGRSARCAVSFTSALDVENPSAGVKSTGQLCGRDVNAAEVGITLGPVSLIGR